MAVKVGFSIQSEILQGVVSDLAKGAARSRNKDKALFVSVEGNVATFFFNGEDLSVERRVEVENATDVVFATSISEMKLKTSLLPKDELITLDVSSNEVLFKWGRNNKVSISTIAETSPLIDVPEVIENVTWKPGYLQIIAESTAMFCATPSNEKAVQNPTILGVNIAKEDTGEVIVRATNVAAAIRAQIDIEWFSGINVSIPKESFLALADLLKREAKVTVGINSDQSLIVFRSAGTTAVSKVLRGKYPLSDVAFVNESQNVSKWTFDKQEVMGLVRRVRTLDGNESVLRIQPKGTKVFGYNRDGILEQQIGGLVEGDSFEFALNAMFVEMALSLFRSEEVLFLFNSKRGPVTICCPENDAVKILVAQLNI